MPNAVTAYLSSHLTFPSIS